MTARLGMDGKHFLLKMDGSTRPIFHDRYQLCFGITQDVIGSAWQRKTEERITCNHIILHVQLLKY